MALTPEELAGLTPFMFEIKVRGFKEGRLIVEENSRKLAWIIYATNVDPKVIKSKSITLDDLWPTEKSIKKAKERNIQAKSLINSTLEKFRKKNL